MLIHRIYRYESFLAAFKESDPEKRERYLLLLCLDLPEPHLHTTSWVWLFPYLAHFLHFPPTPARRGSVTGGSGLGWLGAGLVTVRATAADVWIYWFFARVFSRQQISVRIR